MSTIEQTNRASTVSLRLSPAEVEELRERADQAGVSLSALIRDKLFGHPAEQGTAPTAPSTRVDQANLSGSMSLSGFRQGATFSSGSVFPSMNTYPSPYGASSIS